MLTQGHRSLGCGQAPQSVFCPRMHFKAFASQCWKHFRYMCSGDEVTVGHWGIPQRQEDPTKDIYYATAYAGNYLLAEKMFHCPLPISELSQGLSGFPLPKPISTAEWVLGSSHIRTSLHSSILVLGYHGDTSEKVSEKIAEWSLGLWEGCGPPDPKLRSLCVLCHLTVGSLLVF